MAFFRVGLPYPNGVWVLEASADCTCCRGSGSFTERHGPGLNEPMDCDCVFALLTPEESDEIERGAAFIIEPAPAYLERMSQLSCNQEN